MDVINVVLESTIVLMLGAILFQLGRWGNQVSRRSSTEGSHRPLAAFGSLNSPPDAIDLLRRIDRRLRNLTAKSSWALPWTGLLDGTASRQEVIQKLLEVRQDHVLSMMDELEFQSCAQLVSLSILAQAMGDEGGGETRRSGDDGSGDTASGATLSFPKTQSAD